MSKDKKYFKMEESEDSDYSNCSDFSDTEEEDKVYLLYLKIKRYCDEHSLPIFNSPKTLGLLYQRLACCNE